MRPIRTVFCLVGIAVLLCGCGPSADHSPKPASPAAAKVTWHVPGMADRFEVL